MPSPSQRLRCRAAARGAGHGALPSRRESRLLASLNFPNFGARIAPNPGLDPGSKSCRTVGFYRSYGSGNFGNFRASRPGLTSRS